MMLRPKHKLKRSPFLPFYTEKEPLSYTLKNGTPLTYLVENFAFLLPSVNALSLRYELIKKQSVSSFSQPKSALLALLGLFTVTEFPSLPCASNYKIPTFSYTRYPFCVEPLLIYRPLKRVTRGLLPDNLGGLVHHTPWNSYSRSKCVICNTLFQTWPIILLWYSKNQHIRT